MGDRAAEAHAKGEPGTGGGPVPGVRPPAAGRTAAGALGGAGSRPRQAGRAGQPYVPLAAVLDHADGLVCLSGCATHGVHDRQGLEALREAFTPDHLRVELQRPYLRDDRARNRRLAVLARELELRTVATGNVHAHTRARAPLQDALVAVRHHMPLDASEPLRRGNFSHVLASPAAMAARFAADHPDAVAETTRVADSLRFDLTEHHGYRYPGEEDAHADRTLAELARACLHERYPRGHRLQAEAQARLEEELRIIAALGLSGFFLLHRDMLELAREVALEVRGPDTARALLPPGRGRGSSVSSIVCYLTGLSHVDPIANDLFIGRFLNDELTALPDIDLDFPRDVRAALIPRIHERYGKDRSALVAAFPTYRARGAIRELGKALGLPPGEIERVARGSEGWSARDVAQDVATALGPERLAQGRWAWLARLAEQAHGLPRHLSQHPGGMVVATRPLIDCCPIVPAAMEGRQMVQWDKDSCADAGFLKIDLLGLGMLSAVERAVEDIARHRHERIDLSRIPYDDEPTFRAIQNAETTGVFQIESRAQMASLLRTRPRTLQDITIQVAIVRPGPIQGGAVNPYIERLQRLRADPDFEVPHEHPSLVEPLRETLGTIIFQDQVIEVAMAFAGFSAGQAEGLRRAMSRKRSEAAIEAHHRAFVEGAIATHRVDAELAERIFEKVRGFSGFGFPKAHGAAFGLLAYQSTWLRVHYAPELLCALLNEQPMGFYPPDALVHEAQRRGLTILPPDVNASEVECTVEDIARHRHERIDLSRIPYDDPPTYEAIQSAETVGVFQIESRAQMASLLRTRPRTLQDITIQVAIVRPGPIQGGAVNPYIERLQRLRADPDFEVPYEHPSLVEPLGETLGTIIFQDQVIEVAMAFAGFSAGEAEGLRRAMSRKRSEAAIEAHHRAFVAGAVATHGVSEELAERIFDKVRGFSGFGFPKAHGAAFGLLAYQSTWLRVHYPPEF
ncbi:MAG TPA: hypothetical protein VK506_06860, partial [Conexibacter sp.]|nr:hypothetical protein [Conexibacter sp.]